MSPSPSQLFVEHILSPLSLVTCLLFFLCVSSLFHFVTFLPLLLVTRPHHLATCLITSLSPHHLTSLYMFSTFSVCDLSVHFNGSLDTLAEPCHMVSVSPCFLFVHLVTSSPCDLAAGHLVTWTPGHLVGLSPRQIAATRTFFHLSRSVTFPPVHMVTLAPWQHPVTSLPLHLPRFYLFHLFTLSTMPQGHFVTVSRFSQFPFVTLSPCHPCHRFVSSPCHLLTSSLGSRVDEHLKYAGRTRTGWSRLWNPSLFVKFGPILNHPECFQLFSLKCHACRD